MFALSLLIKETVCTIRFDQMGCVNMFTIVRRLSFVQPGGGGREGNIKT